MSAMGSFFNCSDRSAMACEVTFTSSSSFCFFAEVPFIGINAFFFGGRLFPEKEALDELVGDRVDVPESVAPSLISSLSMLADGSTASSG